MTDPFSVFAGITLQDSEETSAFEMPTGYQKFAIIRACQQGCKCTQCHADLIAGMLGYRPQPR